MEKEYNKELILEIVRTKLEKILMQLNPKASINFHQQYLAGYIDCLHESGDITNDIRDIVYMEYAC